MPDALEFLNAQHSIYTSHKDAWSRDERRLEGTDGVLSELVAWKNEDPARYAARLAQASYLNFASLHATTLAGHLARVAPMPSFGQLGDVRPREEMRGKPTPAELIYYNADGIGSDGTQWPAWWTGAQARACATGHRWILVEMPPAPTPGATVTLADVQAGHRPYLVEFSPLAVPYWEYSHGRLDWAVISVPVGRSGFKGDKWSPAPPQDGFYLLVREGYAGLGDEFAAGGWALYDHDKALVVENGVEMRGTWEKTKGAIPFFPLVAEATKGTTARPAISRSLTMELGQIGISLMNRISERNYDASDAAMSQKYILGVSQEAFNLIASKVDERAVIIPVPATEQLNAAPIVPTIYDSSSGAVSADVFSTIITATMNEAREIMVRQVTSEPGSSGDSKRAGFGEATSPLLAGLAQRRETAENTALMFMEMRAGFETPQAFTTWPTEFEIAPVVSRIDAMLDRLIKIGARSATLETSMLLKVGADDGLVEDSEADAIREELEASLAAAAQAPKIAAFASIATVLDVSTAAKVARLDEEDQKAITTGAEEELALVPDPGANGNGAPPAVQSPPFARVAP